MLTSFLGPEQQLEPVDVSDRTKHDAAEMYVIRQLIPSIGTVQTTLERHTRDGIEKYGEFGDGYVLGEAEVLEDVDAFEKGLFMLNMRIVNPIHIGNETINVRLMDAANNTAYTAKFVDKPDSPNPEESTSHLGLDGADWARQEDPLGPAKLFVPNDPAILQNLHVSFERAQGGETQ
jgi:hypothetical protein